MAIRRAPEHVRSEAQSKPPRRAAPGGASRAKIRESKQRLGHERRPEKKRGDDLRQPHDALFKWTFSQREHAIGLVRAVLPQELSAAIDFDALRLERGTYVDRALSSRHSDLLFSTRIRGRPAYVYTLLEHQRNVDALMIFRMGSYMMRIWERFLRDHPRAKAIPPILPLLVHHSDTGWTAATSFQEVVAVDPTARAAFCRHIPQFEMRVIDLSGGRASDLVEHALTALGKVVLWCLGVAGDDVRLEREIGQLADALDEVVRAPDGLAALEALLRYLAKTHARLKVEKVVELVEKAAGPRAEEAIVTFLDALERRGKREGRAQTLLEQLAARFGEVPAEVRARVAAASERTLARWAVRVLTATTIDEVLAEGGGRASRSPPAAARKRARSG